MKNFLALLLFITIISPKAFPQQKINQNLLKLENSVKETNKNYQEEINSKILPENNSKKSAGLAILYSLLLPGMGELYADAYSSGKYFTIAEAALWGVYIGMNTYGNWQRDRYKEYAASNGGVNISDKNSDYFATIGDYFSVYEYNNEQALNRDFNKLYNTESQYWLWKTNAERKTYRNMWVSSEQTFNDLRFIVGALIVNRIASAINAVRQVSAYNKRISEKTSWNVSIGLSNQQNLPTSLVFNFNTSF